MKSRCISGQYSHMACHDAFRAVDMFFSDNTLRSKMEEKLSILELTLPHFEKCSFLFKRKRLP